METRNNINTILKEQGRTKASLGAYLRQYGGMAERTANRICQPDANPKIRTLLLTSEFLGVDVGCLIEAKR